MTTFCTIRGFILGEKFSKQVRLEITFPSEIINQHNKEMKLRCRLLRQTEILVLLLVQLPTQNALESSKTCSRSQNMVFVFRDDSLKLGQTKIRHSKSWSGSKSRHPRKNISADNANCGTQDNFPNLNKTPVTMVVTC